MLSERLALASVALSSQLAGWSAYHLQRRRSERAFARAGVFPHTAALTRGELHYWLGGKADGTPLLLVHGFGGDALFGWGPNVGLARDHLIVAPDLLWFGESHTHVQDFSPGFQAETILELLDHLALPEVDVVGISYGGFVALELASRAPKRLRRLVIVDSPGHAFTLADYHASLDRLGLDSVTSLIVPPSPAGVKRLLQLAYHYPPPVPAFVARDVFAHMFTRWRKEKVRLIDTLLQMSTTMTPDQYTIRQPALVVWGEHDELFPVAKAHELARLLGPQASVAVIARTNHAPNMERPSEFERVVRQFFSRTTNDAPGPALHDRAEQVIHERPPRGWRNW